MYIDEILDHFKCGKKIRRTSWSSCFYLEKKEDDFYLSADDLLADDWEVIEDKKQWWEPKKDEQYYIICGDGSIDYNNYDGDYDDKRFMAIGNCFQTEEQAEFMAEKLRVIHELEMFAYENNEEEIDWNDTIQEKLYLVMNSTNKTIDVFHTCVWIEIPFNVFFTSEENIKWDVNPHARIEYIYSFIC